jgi:hypothetical protein
MKYFSGKQYSMLIRIYHFLDKREARLIKKVPAFKKIITQFREKVSEVRRLAILHQSRVQMAGAKRRKVKHESITAMLKLVSALVAYANFYKKKELLKSVDYSYSDLNRAKSEIAILRFSRILALAKRTKGIGHFGIQPQHIVNAERQLEEFNKVVHLPMIARKKKAASARLLKKVMRSSILVLEGEVDKLMELALEDDAILLKDYKKTRRLNFTLPGRRSDAESRFRESRKYKPGSRKKKKHISRRPVTLRKETVEQPAMVVTEN